MPSTTFNNHLHIKLNELNAAVCEVSNWVETRRSSFPFLMAASPLSVGSLALAHFYYLAIIVVQNTTSVRMHIPPLKAAKDTCCDGQAVGMLSIQPFALLHP